MTTTSISDTYSRLADGMAVVVDRPTTSEWDSPSPCEGWSARDVLDHVIGTQRDFLQQHGIDLPAAPDTADPSAAWADHVGTVRGILADPDVVVRTVETPFGSMTVGEVFLQFYGFDLVAHRWDIAAVTPTEYRFTDAELDSLETAISGWGDALYSEGICERGPDAEQGADRQARVLAALGRRS